MTRLKSTILHSLAFGGYDVELEFEDRNVMIIGNDGDAAISQYDLVNYVDPSRSRANALQTLFRRVSACDGARNVSPRRAPEYDEAMKAKVREWFTGNIVRGVDFSLGPDKTVTVTVRRGPDGTMHVEDIQKS